MRRKPRKQTRGFLRSGTGGPTTPLPSINRASRQRVADQPTLAAGQPHTVERLARINRDNKSSGRHLSTRQVLTDTAEKRAATSWNI